VYQGYCINRLLDEVATRFSTHLSTHLMSNLLIHYQARSQKFW